MKKRGREKGRLYKVYKIIKIKKKFGKRGKKVFHMEKTEKWLKTEDSTDLSTLSTKNEGYLGDYSGQIKEQAFCEEIMKMLFLRRKRKKILTIKKSNIGKKIRENVYTMKKNDYNKDA